MKESFRVRVASAAKEKAIRHGAAPALVVLNLVRFKNKGRETAGEAGIFHRYVARFTQMIEATGGVVLYAGRPEGVLIGADADRWNAAVVLRYRSSRALGEALSRTEYTEIHSESGLEVSRLVLVSPAPSKRAPTGPRRSE